MTTSARTLLQNYANAVVPTDILPPSELQPVLLGLFGEVGSIMSAAKKLHRENRAFTGYKHAVVEEFGDALWYFAAICRRQGFRLEDAFESSDPLSAQAMLPLDFPPTASPIAVIPELDPTMLALGEAAASLLGVNAPTGDADARLESFAQAFDRALRVTGTTLSEVMDYNLAKTRGRFVDPDPPSLPTFDHTFEDDERLPAHFEIAIKQRSSGLSYMQWNGVFIGDPLSDNILDSDGYRFHDVFHFAHASILHWSPTFRALIKHKRKSDKIVDEAQDGGRAIVVEEGLTAWIFSRAKELGFFEHHNTISFDMLKTIQQFVAGYEVQDCPLRLWERAIIDGYKVFRQVRDNKGGIVIGDRAARSIAYQPLPGTNP